MIAQIWRLLHFMYEDAGNNFGIFEKNTQI